MADEIKRVRYQITGENLSRGAFNEVKASLTGVADQARAFSGVLAAIGATAVFASVASQARELLGAVASLDDFAEKTGASVENLSRFTQVLKLTGGSTELLESKLIKLNKSLQSVGPESQDARNAVAAIGLNFDTLARQDPAQALEEIAKRLATFSDGAGKSAAATALLGRSGAQLLPFLKDLVQYGGLASQVTAQQAAAAENLSNELRRFSLESENVKQAILINLLGPATDLLTGFRELTAAAGGFFELLKIRASSPITQIFGDASAGIANLRKEIEDLESRRPNAQDTSFIDERTAALRREVAVLEARKRADDRSFFRGQGISFGDVQTQQTGPKPTLPFQLGVKPTTTPGTGLSGIKEQADAVLKLNRANSEALLGIDREINQQRLAALDQYHKSAQISIKDYFDIRAGITRDALNAELRDIDGQIAAENARIEQARADFRALGAEGNVGGAANAAKIATDKTIADSTARIIKLEGERSRAQISASGQAIALEAQRRESIEQLTGAVAGLNNQLLAIRGDSVGAALGQFDEANKKLRESLAVNAGAVPGGVEALDSLRAQVEAQERFNKAREAFDAINARLAISEERIQIAQQRGGLSEIDALRATGNERARTVSLLQQQLTALESIAAVSENPRLKLMVEQTRLEIERLSAATDLVGDKFRTVFTDSLNGPLVDLVTQTKKAGDAARDFGRAWLRSLAEIEVKAFTSKLFGQSGVLNTLFSGAGQSPNAIGPTQSGGNLSENVIGKLIGSLLGFATGGSFTVGGSGGTDSQLVAFRASPNERVTIETPQQQRSGAGVTIVQNNTFNGPMDRGMILALLEQSKNETLALVADMRQRGGAFAGAMGR